MKKSSFYIVFCFLCSAVDFATGDGCQEIDVCRDATQLLETIMLFPMSGRSQRTDIESVDQHDTDPWFRSVEEYVDTAWNVLDTTQSFVVEIAYTEIELAKLYGQLPSYLDPRTLDLPNQLLLHPLRKLQNITRHAGNSLLDSLSDLTISRDPLTILILALSDVSMSFRACLTTIWIDGLMATIMESPLVSIRYVVASLLVASLPATVYMLAREISSSRYTYKANGQGSMKLSRDQFDTLQLKSLNLPLDTKTTNMTSAFNMTSCGDTDTVLKMTHYGMSEIYDGHNCNCGGRRSPVVKRRRLSPRKQTHPTRFTLEPAHYPMCEYYDGLLCNCGGMLRKSPVFDLCEMAKTTTDRRCALREVSVESNETITANSDSALKSLNTHRKSPMSDEKTGTHICHREEIPVIDQAEEILLEQTKEKLGRPGEVVNQQENGEPEVDNLSMLTDVSLLEDVESEIGQPMFNSSFREDSPYVSTLGDSIYTDRGSGDGPMLVITRRSPMKECGIGIKVYEEEESSYSEDPETSYDEDDDEEDDEDSLLDVSDINKNISFNNGDGVFEFVVMYALQTIYRTAKRLFSQRAPRSREQSRTRVNDTSQETVYILSNPKPKTKQRRQQSVHRSWSAKTYSMAMQENLTHNGSLTDNDRLSDMSSSYHRNTSGDAVRPGYGSWSLSTSKDDSSFFDKQEQYPPSQNTELDTMKDDIVSKYIGVETHVARFGDGGGGECVDAKFAEVLVDDSAYIIRKLDNNVDKKVDGRNANINNNTFEEKSNVNDINKAVDVVHKEVDGREVRIDNNKDEADTKYIEESIDCIDMRLTGTEPCINANTFKEMSRTEVIDESADFVDGEVESKATNMNNNTIKEKSHVEDTCIDKAVAVVDMAVDNGESNRKNNTFEENPSDEDIDESVGDTRFEEYNETGGGFRTNDETTRVIDNGFYKNIPSCDVDTADTCEDDLNNNAPIEDTNVGSSLIQNELVIAGECYSKVNDNLISDIGEDIHEIYIDNSEKDQTYANNIVNEDVYLNTEENKNNDPESTNQENYCLLMDTCVERCESLNNTCDLIAQMDDTVPLTYDVNIYNSDSCNALDDENPLENK